MKAFYFYGIIGWVCWFCPHIAAAQEDIPRQQSVIRSMEESGARMNRFIRHCERRTEKALRRFMRYERKLQAAGIADSINSDALLPDLTVSGKKNNDSVTSQKGLSREPLLDSLHVAYGFLEQAGLSSDVQLCNTALQSIDRAKTQLDITQEIKSQLQQRKEYWKSNLKQHPEYARIVGKMEKEAYYYTAQVNEFRKVLRNPSVLEETVMQILRKDPRWSEYMDALPQPRQDTEKMQPKRLVQQMMQSQAAAIDPDAVSLIQNARKKSSELLGQLSENTTRFGNLDNAAQMPSFTPNPYKTETFWEHIDVGFNLEFDNKTDLLPSGGIVGLQLSFNFNQRISAGVLGNYRFGMGDIKRIRFSHLGAGYGAFANYIIWKGLGVQMGYERNWRTDITTTEEQHYPSEWSPAALLGVTWEYGIGKKTKGTIGVFYDFLHRKHAPTTNALLWRMGWKF
jgi:hypothetical protein